MRLLVAGQSGGIYIFEVGPGPLDSASEGMPCQEVIASQEEKEGVEEVPQQVSLDHREVCLRPTRWHHITTCHYVTLFSVMVVYVASTAMNNMSVGTMLKAFPS